MFDIKCGINGLSERDKKYVMLRLADEIEARSAGRELREDAYEKILSGEYHIVCVDQGSELYNVLHDFYKKHAGAVDIDGHLFVVCA